MDDEFPHDKAYPKVHENLKLITDERVIEENPESHSGSIFNSRNTRAAGPDPKNQESEKSPKEIIRIKREQGEEKQDSTYSIRSTDKVRKEKKTQSATSGSAQPPSKDDHQSSKKPWESDASASIQHPALTSTGWQITDTRDDVVNSLMHMLPNNIQITDTRRCICWKPEPRALKKKRQAEAQGYFQTLTPAEQESRSDIMKALKKQENEQEKLELEAPNEGTGNILGIRMSPQVILKSLKWKELIQAGFPDEEK
ncbi:hypothetical protein Tco_0842574 [Tanacetum coccineum]|uniref:Uncharacterized protein n=1 Tax=Tanacetum coccineum TaxID=301880 RepID=A0ABQ5B351_9ASTR